MKMGRRKVEQADEIMVRSEGEEGLGQSVDVSCTGDGDGDEESRGDRQLETMARAQNVSRESGREEARRMIGEAERFAQGLHDSLTPSKQE